MIDDAESGARVAQVYISGPAHQAGVKKGDIIKKVNGVAVSSAKDVVAEVGKAKPGDRVALTISRNDGELTIDVVTGTNPARELPQILRSPRVPEMEGLRDIPLQQLFGRFLGGELSYEGKDGQRHTIKVVPGTVKSVTSTSISIEPNDPKAAREYVITDKTVVRVGLAKTKIENLKENDKIVVVVMDDSNEVSAVVKTRPAVWPFQKLIPNAPIPRS